MLPESSLCRSHANPVWSYFSIHATEVSMVTTQPCSHVSYVSELALLSVGSISSLPFLEKDKK